MPLLFLISSALLAALSPSTSCTSSVASCLPAGIQSTDVVSTRPAKAGVSGNVVAVTVAQKLKELRARCRRGKLVDPKGTEIRFYQLIGCWGNPPDDYQEQLERQTKELAKLRKRYHVIEMTCNPAGDDMLRASPPPSNP